MARMQGEFDGGAWFLRPRRVKKSARHQFGDEAFFGCATKVNAASRNARPELNAFSIFFF
jgi:hypothetical protein